jgi:hypothetical protein
VHGDRLRSLGWAAGKQPSYLLGHLSLKLDILASAPLCLPLTPSGPHILVRQALGLGPIKRVVLNQDPLALIPSARTAETNNHGPKATVRLRPPGQRRIPRPHEDEMGQIRALQADRPGVLHHQASTLLTAASRTRPLLQWRDDEQVPAVVLAVRHRHDQEARKLHGLRLVFDQRAAAQSGRSSAATAHLYWANDVGDTNAGTIVEANLNGTGAKTIAKGPNYSPEGVAVGP